MPITAPSATRQKQIFLAALFLIIAVSLISFFSTNRLIALSVRAERSQAILTELNRFMADLQAVETGSRGYLITGQERFLIPHRDGLTKLDETMVRLRRLSDGNDQLTQRLDTMERLARRRVALSKQIVTLRAQGSDPSVLVATVEAGKAVMDPIRHHVGSAIAAEEAAHREREIAVERQVLLTNIVMAIGVALSLAAIAWLFTIRGREVALRRRAEEELKQLNADLEDRVQLRTAEVERSKELLNAVIENMPDTVFLKDVKDQFRYVLINSAGERLLGRQRAELLGHVDHELFPREQATLCHKEDEEIADSGEQQLFLERSVETSLGTRVVESRKIPISDAEGGPRFVLGIVRDITDQRSVENQLRQIQRMDAVGRLTGGIAHDFNNILAIILGNLDLLREQLDDGSEAAEMTDEALGAAMHGAELVRRLLAFARKQHLDPVALDLNERLPAITALLRRTLGEIIQIRVRQASDLWLALVDPSQVDDALVNLAINARDAMPEGGTLSIETGNVTLDDDYAAHHVEVTAGDYVMLAVSDTGSGMSPAVIARAFEPFYTTKAEGQGTGLGLSQVYGWVKQTGGHVKIYSEIGHGTTVKLYLPRANAPRDEAEDRSKGAGEAPRGHERIFVVEDNPNVRSTVRRQLKDLGYSTVEAEDGRTALEMVERGIEFDLLLTDVVMPGGITGYELAEQIGRLRPGLKVLFTSGYTELAVGNGHDGGKGPLLSKPYRKQDLGRAVRAVLDNGE